MPKPILHNGGIIRRTKYGTWLAEYNRAPGRPRKTLPTQEAARDWINRVAIEHRLDLDHSTPADLADAAEARRILDGRASLAEAARLWDRSAGTLHAITVRDAVTKYLALREDDNLRDRAIQTTRSRLNPLLEKFPDAPLHTLTADDLRLVQSGGPTNRNNTRRYLITFWNWALRHHHATANPATALTIAETDESLPKALTLPQVTALLSHTRSLDAPLLPWLCVGLFAGLRAAELDRITAEHIRDGRLHLDPTVTKLRDRRILDLLPPLPAWLDAYPPAGPLRQTNHRKRWDRIKTAAGITDWPNNALRHSFCTYHLAAHQDAAQTAHYSRHESQSTLHRHYIDLASHADGRAFFKLTPKAIKSAADSLTRS